jgi:hypothetical protein
MAGKCPKCEKMIATVRGDHVTVNSPTGAWHGVSYACPYCHSILSVEIDPVALKTDIVKEVVKKLKQA